MNVARSLRRLHLWLGCLFAPVLIFFAISGALQTLALDRWLTKDKKMEDLNFAEQTIVRMSEGHTAHRSGAVKVGENQVYRPLEFNENDPKRLPYSAFITLAALGLLLTTVLGVWMAFRFGGAAWVTAALLVVGVLIPYFLFQWRQMS